MMRRAVTGVIVGVALLASAGGQAAQAAELEDQAAAAGGPG
jgi:hypothetical protein